MGKTAAISVTKFNYLPLCGFEISYNVSLLETNYQDSNHPEFTKELEGTTPDATFVTYRDGTITISPNDSVLLGRTWSVFLTGNVAVNTTVQGPVYGTAEPFKLTVPFLVVHLKNEPPMMQSRVKSLKVYAEVDMSYMIGVPVDMQLDPFYLSEWNFGGLREDQRPTWITFNNSTEVDITEGIYFQINPPAEAVGTSVTLYYTLQD